MSEMLLVSNPRHRRRRNPRHRHHRRHNPRHHSRSRRHNPTRRHRYHRRHNPSLSVRGITGAIMPAVKAGLVGATGALGLDAAWGFVAPKLPASLNNTYIQYAVKALLAVGVGMIGGKFLKGRGQALAAGAMTVATHDLLKSTLQTAMPTLFGPGGTVALSGYNGFGAYLSGSAPIVGTATFPRTYQMQNPGFGAYLSGSNGMTDGAGVYTDDTMGMDPWGQAD